jgi:hypothetical protein
VVQSEPGKGMKRWLYSALLLGAEESPTAVLVPARRSACPRWKLLERYGGKETRY